MEAGKEVSTIDTTQSTPWCACCYGTTNMQCLLTNFFHNFTHHYKVMTLFRNRGWTAIIADMMIDTVLFMVSLGVSLLIGILSVAIAGVVGQGDTSTMAISFVIGAMIAYAICSTLFAVVSSAVNTVIVLYADVRTKWPWRLD